MNPRSSEVDRLFLRQLKELGRFAGNSQTGVHNSAHQEPAYFSRLRSKLYDRIQYLAGRVLKLLLAGGQTSTDKY